ncbi:MAG: hypothetical protein AAFU83_04205, partial [Bacteroidota bacterium]
DLPDACKEDLLTADALLIIPNAKPAGKSYSMYRALPKEYVLRSRENSVGFTGRFSPVHRVG